MAGSRVFIALSSSKPQLLKVARKCLALVLPPLPSHGLGLDTMSFLEGAAGVGAAMLVAICVVNAATWLVRRPTAWPMSFMSCRQSLMVGGVGGAVGVVVGGGAVPDPEAIGLSNSGSQDRSFVCSSSERSSQS